VAKDSFGKKVDEKDENAKVAPFVQEVRQGISLEAQMASDGFDGNDIPEVRVTYEALKTEKIIRGKYNCHIVLGRDRPGWLPIQLPQPEDPYGKTTGYGGNGFKNCSSIDIVAGVGGVDPNYVDGSKRKLVKVGPSFQKDAARIYISQTTDLDRDFNIGLNAATGDVPTDRLPIPAIGDSGIGIKADHVRVIARKEMKLITGGDSVDSNDEPINFIGGIALIGGADEKNLQPLVKGDNLKAALEQMLKYMENLSGMLEKINANIRDLGQDLMSHSHNSPFFGAPTGPPSNGVGFKASSEALNFTLKEVIGFKQALPKFRLNYLNPAGSGYINSGLNSTN